MPTRFAPLLLAGLVLAACSSLDRLTSPMGGPPLEDISILDGKFNGRASFARGDSNCEREFQILIEVERGRVKGEFSVPRTYIVTPRGEIAGATVNNAAPTTFQTYIDNDGQMSATRRARSGVYYMQGRFRPDRYNGVLVPENTLRARDAPQGTLQLGTYTPCSWNVLLARSP